MIRWNNDQYRHAHSVASAILRMIGYEQITTEDVADLLGVSPESISDILTEDPPALSASQLRALFVKFNLSPLYVLTEEGETHFKVDNPTGRMLEALNKKIEARLIESIPSYFRQLGIGDEREYMKLCLGHMAIDAKRMLRLCTLHDVNPAYIYAPVDDSPVFVD